MLQQASGEFIYAKHFCTLYKDKVPELYADNYKNTLSMFDNAITSMNVFQRELNIRHSQDVSAVSSKQNIILILLTVVMVPTSIWSLLKEFKLSLDSSVFLLLLICVLILAILIISWNPIDFYENVSLRIIYPIHRSLNRLLRKLK